MLLKEVFNYIVKEKLCLFSSSYDKNEMKYLNNIL